MGWGGAGGMARGVRKGEAWEAWGLRVGKNGWGRGGVRRNGGTGGRLPEREKGLWRGGRGGTEGSGVGALGTGKGCCKAWKLVTV